MGSAAPLSCAASSRGLGAFQLCGLPRKICTTSAFSAAAAASGSCGLTCEPMSTSASLVSGADSLGEQTKKPATRRACAGLYACSAGQTVPLQVVVNAVGESNRIASDVFDGHRNGREAAFLQSGRLQPVTQHALATRVPLNAVVFGDDKRFRPREVDAPDSAVPVDDAVLQLWHRQPRVEEHQSRLALYRRLGTTVGAVDQLTDLDDSAAPLLLGDRDMQFRCSTGSDVQGSVKCRQSARSPERPSDFDYRPRGRCRQSTLDPSQRCADSLVHHETS